MPKPTKTKIPFCPALENPEVAAKVNKVLEQRNHADYLCYMALKNILPHLDDALLDAPPRSGLEYSEVAECRTAIKDREELNEKFMLLVSGRTT